MKKRDTMTKEVTDLTAKLVQRHKDINDNEQRITDLTREVTAKASSPLRPLGPKMRTCARQATTSKSLTSKWPGYRTKFELIKSAMNPSTESRISWKLISWSEGMTLID